MNSTIQESKKATDTISLKATVLRELLEGVSLCAHKGSDLATLNAVSIEAGEGKIIARATDRFRLIKGEVVGEGDLYRSILIPLADIKRVITLIKEEKWEREVQLSRVGDMLSVTYNSNTLTILLCSGTFPPSDHLFPDISNPSPIGEVMLNPALLADYGKIAGKKEGIKLIFSGAGKPITVQLPENKNIKWSALIMPMRIPS
jgi:DNA polymerase III sliding clamp (beta) subunit (PCNA family)